MARHILIRDAATDELVVPEDSLPSEAQLHRALAAHPELIPTEDLGMGRSIVVATEARVDSGRADLVLLDEHGRVGIVEVKKEGNPDTRRVIAQVLDYAASLWGLSIDEFKALAVESDGDRDLEALLGEELVADDSSEDAGEGLDRILAGLEATLSSGNFVMAVAAPSIPSGVQRVIDYLGHHGHRLYGLEYSYFRAEVREIFVPRVVAGPPASERTTQGRTARGPLDRDAVVRALHEHDASAAEAARCVLDWATNADDFSVRFTPKAAVIETAGLALLKIWPARPDRPLEVSLGRLRRLEHPWDEERIRKLATEIGGIDERLTLSGRDWPRVPLEPLADESARTKFTGLMETTAADLTVRDMHTDRPAA